MSTDPELRIVVIDYGAGNLRSVARAIATTGVEPRVSSHPADLAQAQAAILPGVGAAGAAMRGLTERGLIEPIRAYVASGRPLLGVCLGLQVMLSYSDEDHGVNCLGIIPGRVVRLPETVKLPQIGWNQVRQVRPHRVFRGIPDQANFYFVHSYVAVPDDPKAVIATTAYGTTFACAIAAGNVVATQFHPEKSAADGLCLYRNFVDWARELTFGAPIGAPEQARP